MGECVCERIGRCAPLSWKGPKISQQQICRLRNGSFLFFYRSQVLLASFYLQGGGLALDLLGANGDAGEGFRQLRKQGEGKQLLGGFCWLAEAQGAQWCCTLLKSTTSSVNTGEHKGGRRSAGLPKQTAESHDRRALNANRPVMIFAACDWGVGWNGGEAEAPRRSANRNSVPMQNGTSAFQCQQ